MRRYRWEGEGSRLARDDGHEMRMDDVEAAVLIAAGAAPAANRAEKVSEAMQHCTTVATSREARRTAA